MIENIQCSLTTHLTCHILPLSLSLPLPLYFADTIHLRVLESSPVGTAIGSVKATDADTGKNAEVEYRIIDGDGTDMFDILTEKDTQEGIITVKKVHSIGINKHPTVRQQRFQCVLSTHT